MRVEFVLDKGDKVTEFKFWEFIIDPTDVAEP